MKILNCLLFCICLITIQQSFAQEDQPQLGADTAGIAVDEPDFFEPGLDHKTIELSTGNNPEQLLLLSTPATYEGNTFEFRGRTNPNDHIYIDGVAVDRLSLLPKMAMQDFMGYNGFTPLSFENSGAGIISVNSLDAPQKTMFSIELFGDLAVKHELAVNQKGIALIFNSPIPFLKFLSKDKAYLPSILLTGSASWIQDPTPSFRGYSTVNQGTYNELQARPIFLDTNNILQLSANYITSDQVQTHALKSNAGGYAFNPYLKLTFPFTKNLQLTVGTFANIGKHRIDLLRNSMFNSENNPELIEQDFYPYLKLEHKFKIAGDISGKYRIQFNYKNSYRVQQSAQHEDRFFDYGYIGKYTHHYQPSYAWGYDDVLGMSGYLFQGMASAGVDFEPGTINPGSANFMEQFYSLYPEGSDEINNSDAIVLSGGILNGMMPPAVQMYMSSYGAQTNQYSKQSSSSINPKLDLAIDFGDDHAIDMGVNFIRSNIAQYNIQPQYLWSKMRYSANQHLQQMDLLNPHPVYDSYGVYQDTIQYDWLYEENMQTLFSRQLREKLGLAINGTEWIDVDSYAPDSYSLDLFSADELLRDGFQMVSYFGYDYTGKRIKNNNVGDFFKDKNSEGYYTREIGSFTPNDLNSYIQYSYAGKKFNARAGIKIDRYDAHQLVPKDPYILREFYTAGEVTRFGPHPANIGEDYAVYVDNLYYPYMITGYRNGDTWYDRNGVEVESLYAPYDDPIPYLQPTFNLMTEAAFTDYKPILNYLPTINLDYRILKYTQIFADFQMYTRNPVNNSLQLDRYYFLGRETYLNNPNLKPEKTTEGRIGLRQLFLGCLQAEASVMYEKVEGITVPYTYWEAFPNQYFTVRNSPADLNQILMDISLQYRSYGRHEIIASALFERLLSDNTDFSDIVFSKNVLNAFVQYRFNKKITEEGINSYRPILNICLSGHHRSGSYYYHSADYLAGDQFVKLPGFFKLDLKVEKPIFFGKRDKLCMNIYLAAQNLLNLKNVFYVYPLTGKANDDGLLSTSWGQAYLQAQYPVESFKNIYDNYTNNYSYYDTPCMITGGLRFEL